MMRDNYDNIKKIFIVFLSILLVLLNSFETSIYLQISSYWIFFVCILIFLKFDFFNPYIWFIGIQILYSTSYPILYSIGLRETFGYSYEPLFINSIAILVLCVVLPIKKVELGTINCKSITNNEGIKRIISFTFLILCLISIFLIIIGGYSNKVDIYENNSFLSFVLSFCLICINFYSLDLINKIDNNKKYILLIMLIGVSVLLLMMFTGERDLFFRFIVITLMTLYFTKKVSKKMFIITLLSFMILLPVTSILKYYFISGNLNSDSSFSSFNDIIESFLSGEFESASRNLQILVSDNNSNSIMGGKTFVSDFTRVFGYAPYSSVNWFQNRYFSYKSVGMGFTLVGEGYINFGYIGVVFVYLVVGLLIRLMYKYSNKNIYLFGLYVCSIPMFMYIIRADLANFISPFFRQVLPAMILFYILNEKIVKNNVTCSMLFN